MYEDEGIKDEVTIRTITLTVKVQAGVPITEDMTAPIMARMEETAFAKNLAVEARLRTLGDWKLAPHLIRCQETDPEFNIVVEMVEE